MKVARRGSFFNPHACGMFFLDFHCEICGQIRRPAVAFRSLERKG